ncbi:intercellular trafficking and secretion [Dimargaris cristalligena]|nr:intercellular trafficking and secretion [Dimargaris cristalligena]
MGDSEYDQVSWNQSPSKPTSKSPPTSAKRTVPAVSPVVVDDPLGLMSSQIYQQSPPVSPSPETPAKPSTEKSPLVSSSPLRSDRPPKLATSPPAQPHRLASSPSVQPQWSPPSTAGTRPEAPAASLIDPFDSSWGEFPTADASAPPALWSRSPAQSPTFPAGSPPHRTSAGFDRGDPASSGIGPSTLPIHSSPAFTSDPSGFAAGGSPSSVGSADACPYEIHVSDPRKESDGTAQAHISYLVSSLKKIPGSDHRSKTTLRRRYQDFVWLHSNLSKDYPACALPPLPGKYRMEYITGDRFSDDFVQKRRSCLERFLTRLARHPLLRTSHYFVVFLEARDWSSEYEEKAKGESMLENLSDAFLNAFSKIKKRDEKFIEIKEIVDKLEENLTAVEKLYSRIGKRETEAAEAYAELSKGLLELSRLESGVTQPLAAAGRTVGRFSDQLKTLTGGIDETYLSQIHEYIAYSHCFKAILKLRDQKQVDFEELSHYLQTTTAELERISQNQSASLGGFTSFIKGKYREMKGVDHEQLRRERIARLEKKVSELQPAVEVSHEEATKCSDIVTKELDVFQNIKTADFKQHLGDLADHQIQFYERAMATWESLIPMLESVELDD